jgi:hypothetical protein
MRPLALLLLFIPAAAQTQGPKPEFEVASVKPLPEGPHPGLLIICRGGPGPAIPRYSLAQGLL